MIPLKSRVWQEQELVDRSKQGCRKSLPQDNHNDEDAGAASKERDRTLGDPDFASESRSVMDSVSPASSFLSISKFVVKGRTKIVCSAPDTNLAV